MNEIKIKSEFIKLDAFMKWAAIVSTGAEAKMYILDGDVLVNGEIEQKRGRKLYSGDIVTFNNEKFKVVQGIE
ncbi:S4 domain-containing protein YaaA [Hathewaya histolytica]|uniref:S4 domain-containing protein YaaA n=1 Tax=Hathewaya histolytica TaxID=1498 RepID=A0A4U9QVF4_HATHI|nr:S4 domain-containing protein YaaA [Hathewaya histolytica]VTQ81443.1 S4 domain-containing protein YaaA [Hathewaya histolytica]